MRMIMNEDAALVASIRQKIKDNDGYCPCKIEKIPENKCMCMDFINQTEPGECHCGLFLQIE